MLILLLDKLVGSWDLIWRGLALGSCGVWCLGVLGRAGWVDGFG